MKFRLSLLLIISCSSLIAVPKTPDHHRQLSERTHRAATKTPVIINHGGPVMVNPKDLYVIYYGSFTSTQHAILDNFLQNLGGSPAFNVNSEYSDSTGQRVSNILNYSPSRDSFNDSYSLGTSLSSGFDVPIIRNAIANGHLPSDGN